MLCCFSSSDPKTTEVLSEPQRTVKKFRGCLLGGLIGDSFGSPFEWDNGPVAEGYPLAKWPKFLAEKLSFSKGKEGPILLYTDDTEMAISIAESLIQKNSFDAHDIAHRFAEEFFRPNRPSRGYGTFVSYVFDLIKRKDYTDIFQPAKKQFDGQGSLGNGGAMRTHPVSLFCYNKSQEELVDISRKTAQITHANLDGYNGAILQALAIRFALEADPEQELDTTNFLEKLKAVMTELEAERPAHPKFPSYCSQLDKIKEFLENDDLPPHVLGERLGNEVTAPLSVPIALYCFLRSLRPLPAYQTDNRFLRALYMSVAVGGDTDTIGCMTCSLAGAFYGTPTVPQVLYEQCESNKVVLAQADRMAALLGVQ